MQSDIRSRYHVKWMETDNVAVQKTIPPKKPTSEPSKFSREWLETDVEKTIPPKKPRFETSKDPKVWCGWLEADISDDDVHAHKIIPKKSAKKKTGLGRPKGSENKKKRGKPKKDQKKKIHKKNQKKTKSAVTSTGKKNIL